ncbi:MAG: hypothetical protein JWP74_3905 [Marmoricola sp.]|nr:hypothetical protein [Marmoricola sp.]
MPVSDPPRTLADQFRTWPDERIVALLDERPDLGVPAPLDSAQLASRAVVKVSTVRALDLLDHLQLEVLTAVVQVGPAASKEIAELVNADAGAVAVALDRLAGLALIWGTPEVWRPVTVVADLLGIPAGPPAADIAGLLAELDDRARTILDHLDETGASGTVADARAQVRLTEASSPTDHLLARRLLMARDDRHVVVPWTVRLHLRAGRSTREPADAVPELATSARDQAMVDRAAAGAAYEFTRRTELLLDAWATRPPSGLRAGGLGVRDLRVATELVHADAGTTALVIETAAAAQLLALGMNDDLDAAWLPTDAYDSWAARSAAERWQVLATAWLTNPRLVSAIGGRDGDRPINALSAGLERTWLPGDRRTTLESLLVLEPGRTLAAGTGIASLVARLRWRHPRRSQARLDLAATTLTEAAALGLTGLDGLAGYARTLLAGGDPGELATLLPTPVDHVLIQADLTAVAPGPLEQDFARRLGVLADIESRGGATVYRFTVDSVRRGFDSGWSAVEVKDFLSSSSRTPVPQALDYLVDDVARRFGTLRLGAAESFLRSDDETALTELMHTPAAASLRLRRIAPTVIVSDVPLQVLLPRLRELGAAPVVEAADGTVRIARPDEYRSRTPKAPPGSGRASARLAARGSAVVAAIRAGDRAAASRPSGRTASSPGDVLNLLRSAVEDGEQVMLDFVDNHGRRTERVVRPVRIEGGELVAHDDREDELRTYAVHRIGSVRTIRTA